jgi:hypothetical protein
VERQAEQLVSQAEAIGTLRAELAAERAKSLLDASTAPQSVETAPEPFTGRLRPPLPWLMTTLAIVAMVVLLAWLQ